MTPISRLGLAVAMALGVAAPAAAHDTNWAEPFVRASIEKLGFKTSDIKIMLSSHVHVDHVGGHAAIQELTGAAVMAPGDDAAALSSGVDSSALGGTAWKKVKVGRVLRERGK
jgi:metallo-beta-lactamase class B